MADTSRIVSGFDVEMHLGSGWFALALQGLADHGLLIPDPPPPPIPPGAVVVVDGSRCSPRIPIGTSKWRSPSPGFRSADWGRGD
ncbi:MAG TPA: hypothetical protein VHM94_03890 [Acidimicrobiia bacterium]|nr:hypothetical protein [Acidimicrobiia bacterium]